MPGRNEDENARDPFHTLLFDGVFFAGHANGELDFRPLPPPTDEEVGVVLTRITTKAGHCGGCVDCQL